VGAAHHRGAAGAGVTTMLVTDHPHLFEIGGEDDHIDFSGREYVRGHEGDARTTEPLPQLDRRAPRPVVPHAPPGWGSRDRPVRRAR
jgi:hypothetical protein